MSYSIQWKIQPPEKPKDSDSTVNYKLFGFNPSKREKAFKSAVKYRQADSSRKVNLSINGLERDVSITKSKVVLEELLDSSFFTKKQTERSNKVADLFHDFKISPSKFFGTDQKEEPDQTMVQIAEQIKIEKKKENDLAQSAREKLQKVLEQKPQLFTKQFYVNFKNQTKYFDHTKIPQLQGESLLERIAQPKQRQQQRHPKRGMLGLVQNAVLNKERLTNKYKITNSIHVNSSSPMVILERLTPNLLKERDTFQLNQFQEQQEKLEAELLETYYKRRQSIEKRLKHKQKAEDEQFL